MIKNKFESIKITLPHPLVDVNGDVTPFYEELMNMELSEWSDEKTKYRQMFKFLGGEI
jgi:hypothetical protein